MRRARIRQFVHRVEFLHRQRNRRRIQPHVLRPVTLHQRSRVAGIRFHVQDARRVRVQHRVVAHRVVGRQANDADVSLRTRYVADKADDLRRTAANDFVRPRAGDEGAIAYGSGCGVTGPGESRCVESTSIHPSGTPRAHKYRAAHVVDRLDRFARRETMRNFRERAFGVAVQQHVGLRIEQHRTPHLLRPVVEVRDASQARFDAADDDRHVVERFARALRIHDHAAIGSAARLAARRVRVVAADAPIGGVAIHHRVHVAGGDAEEQVRPAEPREVVGAAPVGLRDHADAKTLRFEQAARRSPCRSSGDRRTHRR